MNVRSTPLQSTIWPSERSNEATRAQGCLTFNTLQHMTQGGLYHLGIESGQGIGDPQYCPNPPYSRVKRQDSWYSGLASARVDTMWLLASSLQHHCLITREYRCRGLGRFKRWGLRCPPPCGLHSICVGRSYPHRARPTSSTCLPIGPLTLT